MYNKIESNVRKKKIIIINKIIYTYIYIYTKIKKKKNKVKRV